jgi:fibronectin-binding autotransporter adhesin
MTSNNPSKTALPGIGTSYAIDGGAVSGVPSEIVPGSIPASALQSGLGSGSVTSVATGNGLTGGPVTTTGTISVASGTADTLAGYNNSGVFSNVTIGTNLTLSGGVLNATGGGSGSPGGSSGQVQYNNSGSFGGFTVSGDGTLNTGTGALTVTKTNGVAFVASATTDTTNASNISSGSLALGRIAAIGANTVLGSIAGAAPIALTATQLTTIPNVFTNVLQGVAPASGGGAVNFLRADGTWAVPAGSGGGTVTTTGTPASGNLSAFSGSTSITNTNLTGDVTTSGGVATTLATVNSNVGSFTSANITVNAKGLITAAANGSGGGGLTSVGLQGDGTVIATSVTNSPLTANGTLGPLTLANAAAYTALANSTASSAAPTYAPSNFGYGTIAGTTTLTANSPSFNFISAGGVAITMPAASSCPGKLFQFYTNSAVSTLSRAGSDQFNINSTLSNSVSVSLNNSVGFWSDGVSKWYPLTYNLLPIPNGGTGLSSVTNGAVFSASGAAYAFSAAGTAGQILQSAGNGVPTWTSTPGSGTSLTSITATHQIAGGTAPTIAAGAGAGTGPTVSITGHDTDCQVTITTGTTPTGTNAVIATVTYGTTYTTVPMSYLQAANANAAGLIAALTAPYVTNTATTAVLTSGTTALTGSTTYIFNLHTGL